MEKFGCKLDRSLASNLGPNLSTFNCMIHGGTCSLQPKLDKFYRNMSIFDCIQSQDLNLIALFSFTNRVVKIDMCANSLQREKWKEKNVEPL